MTYRDFNFNDVAVRLGLTLDGGELFAEVVPAAPPAWLPAMIGSTPPDLLVTEKSRSEFLVAPILRALQQTRREIRVFSGLTLSIDAAKGLAGECDFILARSEPISILKAPVMSVVEAKRGVLDDGMGQCIAQMRGLQIFNSRAGHSRPIWGAVTTGREWQFLRLDADAVTIDPSVYYLNELEVIFARLLETVKPTERGGAL